MTDLTYEALVGVQTEVTTSQTLARFLAGRLGIKVVNYKELREAEPSRSVSPGEIAAIVADKYPGLVEDAARGNEDSEKILHAVVKQEILTIPEDELRRYHGQASQLAAKWEEALGSTFGS